MTAPELLTYVNSAGVIGLLSLAIWLGYSGKVIPSALLDEIVRATVLAILEEMEERRLLPPK